MNLFSALTRRQFIKILASAMFGLISGRLFASGKQPLQAEKAPETSGVPAPVLSVIQGSDHRAVTRRAVEAVGGMNRFVKKGDTVVVKPNMSWDRTPEQAANTNPVVIEEVIKMCYEAGARKVKVFDRCCANPERSYKNSGVADSARKAGADVFHVDDWNYVEAGFKYDSPLKGWPIYRDAVEADCFINLPVLKHHRLTGLTLSMKNLMGVMGGNRGTVHWDISTKLAHLADYIRPDLNIMDATRVLIDNGPTGGRLEDVKIYNTIIAGTDFVLVDSESARLVGKDPMDIGYIKAAAGAGFGKTGVSPGLVVREKV
ncbi:MAG: DUF362 domain-containing protein [Elusimicrobia bacterium]|nr:DUF362 domain-containing protein [Elusimicrobiota bacterium]